QMLRDIDARSAGADRLKFAGDVVGRFRLQVPHIDGGRTTAQPDEDDAPRSRPAPFPPRLLAEPVRQSQSEQARRANRQKVAPVEPLTIAVPWRVHGDILSGSI